MTTWTLKGHVAAAAFASGDSFVLGSWDDTPIGACSELRWTRPDGSRTLLTTDESSAQLFGALYHIDDVDIGPVRASGTDRWAEVVAGPIEMQLQAKRGWRLPSRRPRLLTQLVEDPLARAALGARAYTATPAGVRVWYRADVVRRVAAGWATLDGRDLGALRGKPWIAAARPAFEDASGRLDAVVRAAARARVTAR